MADKSIRFLELMGFGLDEWQQWTLRQMLGLRADKTFASKEVCLLVPRRNGKTRVLEARSLVGLFVLKEPLVINTAQVFPTCRESYLNLKRAIDNCPDLEMRKVQFRAGNDNLSIEYQGRRILYKARGKNPIRGLSPQVIIADEAYAMDDEIAAAIENAVGAAPNRQFICTSSTGLDDSDWLLRMRERGLSEQGKHTLALMEWCAEPGCDLDDLEQYFRANPALGIRVSLESLVSARRGQPDKQFGRERLGLWADNKFRSVIDLDLWADLGKDSSEIDVTKYVVALDATPSAPHDAAIALAGFNAKGKKQVEVVRTGRSLSWCLEALQKLCQAGLRPPPLGICVQAGSVAGGLIPEIQKLRDRDGNPVEVIPFGARDVTDACGYLFETVTNRSLCHLNDISLSTALSGATRIRVGKLDGPKGEEEYRAWYWGRKDVLVDISPLCAITYALWGLNMKISEEELNRKHYEGKPFGGGIWLV
ncbi:MAG: hypothetical protein A4E20_10795 [Nitrospira sp. SG-bin2]|uniref:hypothetical protein n=1 Tax=Nitrospira cf. moscoviensis SBR1015 TaxID=96242 RepID=UPI000A0DE3FF|nr:hypothetical protein [Nitrospira cf. moscoviensis SBR1015]OQW34499.1 MAG: hypothetical protein A4E20_10795 [Nitrospira sp. SG-bin2]